VQYVRQAECWEIAFGMKAVERAGGRTEAGKKEVFGEPLGGYRWFDPYAC
jgi:hypothetical protein